MVDIKELILKLFRLLFLVFRFNF